MSSLTRSKQPADAAPARAPAFIVVPRPSRREALRRVRRSLRASTGEGLAAEVVGACTSGAVLTGWGLHLGASPAVLGLLVSLASAAQLLQLPAAWVTSLLGGRRVAIAANAAGRVSYAALAALPLLPASDHDKLAVLLAVTALASALGVIGNNGWQSWMSELVPERVRGRYFGRRNALCTLGSMVASLAAGRVLDHAAGPVATERALAGLSLVAAAAGLAAAVLMSRQHEVSGPPPPRPSVAQALRPFGHGASRGALAYTAAFGLASGLGTSFFALHVLGDLGLGFTVLALHAAGTAVFRGLALSAWGRCIDRLGARPVLVASSFGLALSPVLWLAASPRALWPLAVDAVLTGVLAGAQGLAAFAMPMAVAPRALRPYFLAVFSLVGGLGTAVAATLGGRVAALLPARFELGGREVYALQLLFLATALARVGAAALALRIREPGARGVRDLGRVVRDTALAGRPVPPRVRVG